MRRTCSSSTVAVCTLNATTVSVCFLSHRLSSRLINISDQSLGVPWLLLTHIRQHNKTTHQHKRQKGKNLQCAGCKSAVQGQRRTTFCKGEEYPETCANMQCLNRKCFSFHFFVYIEKNKMTVEKWLTFGCNSVPVQRKQLTQ